jgi:hypothetical protein
MGHFGCARWNRGWTFLHKIKAFLDVILLIFHAQEIFKSTTHNPGPHPMKFDHDISVPSPDRRIYIATAIFQQTKMKGNVADNLVNCQ